MSFFWFQLAGGEDAWRVGLSEHRAQIIREQQPAFVTVLDAHEVPEDSWGREDYAKMRYSGPLYFDWDAEDVSEAITNFHLFIAKLLDIGVDLASIRMYATGGRGFHMEIPQGLFMDRVPKAGVTGLPYVYREMAMELVVDTLDMRVYTGRKGRMWRTPGIERSNGKFKVPLTVEQATGMTPELYDEVCSEPREAPELAIPLMNLQLAAMFVKASKRVEEAVKRRAKAGNADEALLAKFKGQFPPTLQKIMRGEGLAENVGFHKIAMQLAITANALGKTADQLVEDSIDLCKNYSGDSSRYGSPRRRKEELRRMWEYTHDNPCYSYSKGGIRALLDVEVASGDLDGVEAHAGVGYVPEDEEEETGLPEDVSAEINVAQAALLEGLMITTSGVHKRTAEGARTISNIGFRKPTLLVELEDLTNIGMEAEVLCDGESMGRRRIQGRAFTSRANLSAWCSDHGGIFSGTDTQAGAVQLMLSRAAKAKGRVVYALHKEGLDVVQNPLIKDKALKNVVWVHPDRVVTDNEEAGFVFVPLVSDKAIFRSDAHLADVIKGGEDEAAWLEAVLSFNRPDVVALMLGWTVSCLHRQFYHQAYKQFPLLHPNGPAGCGKTLTTSLLAQIYHMTTEPVLIGCGASSTAFTLKAALTGSASVPLILDEFKPSEMGPIRTDLLLQSFRLSYNQSTGSSGGMTKGNAGGSFRSVTEYTYSSPVAFLAESQEQQTAVVQRYIPVAFNPHEKFKYTPAFERATVGRDLFPQLGKLLLSFAFQETVESRREAVDPLIADLRKTLDPNVHDRQVFNLAVVIAGLQYLQRCLRPVFKDRFTGRLDELIQTVYDHKVEIAATAMSEAAKMFSDLALISRTEPDESDLALKFGSDYIVGDGWVEVLMRESFVKYFAWCKRKGFTPLYSSPDAFLSAMSKFPPVLDKVCLTSPLKKSGQTRVYRFSLEGLTAEGVELFRSPGDK